MKRDKDFIVLLDPGHGENTPGKRSPDGKFREYLFAREVAQEIERELRKSGYKCERIIKCAMDVSLAERAKIVNEYCKEYGTNNVILISIHVNAAGNGEQWMNARGFEIYTSPGKTKSDVLAECIFEAAKALLPDMNMRADLSDGDHDKEARFAMLTQTKCVAVLSENLFQDNREDVAFLCSSEGKKKIVELHLQGILNYINKIKK